MGSAGESRTPRAQAGKPPIPRGWRAFRDRFALPLTDAALERLDFPEARGIEPRNGLAIGVRRWVG